MAQREVEKTEEEWDKVIAVDLKGPFLCSQAAAREMVSTVSDWVSDFKQRKHDETKMTLDSFFAPVPATGRT